MGRDARLRQKLWLESRGVWEFFAGGGEPDPPSDRLAGEGRSV
jgi:hypothetical protein